jgi:hypothetical protein
LDERIIEIVEDESRGPPSMASVSMVRVGSDKAQYDLFFTDRRIIAATVFSQSDISDLAAVANFQSMFTWKKTRKNNREEFKGKTPDEILHMHKDSFELPYEKIKSIQIKKGLTSGKLIVEVYWENDVQSVDLKIPKKKIEHIETLIHTYLAAKVV